MISADQEMACAICGPGTAFQVMYPARIPRQSVDFSARRTPSRSHFRIVQCTQCGLIYSNPIFPTRDILEFYRTARFLNEPQLENMRSDYAAQLNRIIPRLVRRERLLEIGCGNGFFLTEAKLMGFAEVIGVEPSKAAIESADPEIRNAITNEFFCEGLFAHESFDVVCFFQVLDHLTDPVGFLAEVRKVLRPDGLVLAVCHNIRSWLPRVLGDRCGMYDVEHVYLFSLVTIAKLFGRCGFKAVHAENMRNSYTLAYALKMLPVPRFLKSPLYRLLLLTGIAGCSVRVPAGNMVAAASPQQAT